MTYDPLADLDRIRQHIPHLEAAAADETAHPLARVAVRLEIDAYRLALDLSGHSRTVPNDTPTPRTEATP